MRTLADEELVAAIRSGNEPVIEAFCRELRPRLAAFAWQRGVPEAEIEDVVQETLAAGVLQIREGRFLGRSALRTWVHAIFVHKADDVIRQMARRGKRVQSLEALSERAGSVDALTPISPADQEARLGVREAMRALPYRQRLVLWLNTQQGLPARRIAPMLRLNVKTVEGILTAAKKQFTDMVRGGQEKMLPRRLRRGSDG